MNWLKMVQKLAYFLSAFCPQFVRRTSALVSAICPLCVRFAPSFHSAAGVRCPLPRGPHPPPPKGERGLGSLSLLAKRTEKRLATGTLRCVALILENSLKNNTKSVFVKPYLPGRMNMTLDEARKIASHPKRNLIPVWLTSEADDVVSERPTLEGVLNSVRCVSAQCPQTLRSER